MVGAVRRCHSPISCRHPSTLGELTAFSFFRFAVRRRRALRLRPEEADGKVWLAGRAPTPTSQHHPETDRRETQNDEAAKRRPVIGRRFAMMRKIWSGRRGSNPRPRPWQGRALPLSYTRIRDGGDRSPATAHLCQMRTMNATLLRTVKIRPLETIYREMVAKYPESSPRSGSRRLKVPPRA